MKCLRRNARTFHYCLFSAKVAVEDTNHLKTGEYKLTYSSAVSIKGNISPATGNSNVEQFGNFTDYDKVIVIEDPNCPIDENTVLFIDKDPVYDTESTPLYDYRVRKVARSINSVSYAIQKAEVS